VVHLARTPRPASKDVQDESAGGTAESQSKVEHLKPLKSVQDIQEVWVADHAKHVGIHRDLYKGGHSFKFTIKNKSHTPGDNHT